MCESLPPFGDCSLPNGQPLCQCSPSRGDELNLCFEMATSQSARLMNADDYGLEIGNRADLIVLDAPTTFAAVTELAQPLLGFKAGKQTFSRPRPKLFRPGDIVS